MNQTPFKKKSWSPYTVGTLLGVLSWITFAFMNKALGVSTTFVRIVGIPVDRLHFRLGSDSDENRILRIRLLLTVKRT